MTEFKKIQELWKDKTGRSVRINFSTKGKKPEYSGLAVITQKTMMTDGNEQVKDFRVEFLLEVEDIDDAFDKFDDAARDVAQKMKEDAEKKMQEFNSRIIRANSGDLDRLRNPGNNGSGRIRVVEK